MDAPRSHGWLRGSSMNVRWILLVAVCVPRAARADDSTPKQTQGGAESTPHDGLFYVQAGVGLGYFHVAPHEGAGVPVMLRVGVSPLRSFVLDPALLAIPGTGSAKSVWVDEVGGFVSLYPSQRSGFHVDGSAGFATLVSGKYSGICDLLPGVECFGPAKGIMFGVGAGFDLHVSRRWSTGFLTRLDYARLTSEADLPPRDVDVPYTAVSLLFTMTYY